MHKYHHGFPCRIFGLVLLLFSCGGFDGPLVIKDTDVDDLRKEAYAFHGIKCSPDQDLPDYETSSVISAFAAGALALEEAVFLGTNTVYYYKRDVETCYYALLSAPCPQSELEAPLLIADALYCTTMEPVSLWEHQHFGQGGWKPP